MSPSSSRGRPRTCSPTLGLNPAVSGCSPIPCFSLAAPQSTAISTPSLLSTTTFPLLPLSSPPLYPCDTSSVHSPPAAGDVSCTSCCTLVCNSNDDARDRIRRSLPRIPRTTKTATQTCSAEPSGQFQHRIDDPHRTALHLNKHATARNGRY